MTGASTPTPTRWGSTRGLLGAVALAGVCSALSLPRIDRDVDIEAHQNPDPSYVAVPRADERTISYYHNGMVAWGIGGLLAVGLPLAAMALGVLPTLRRTIHRWHWSQQAVILGATYAIMAFATVTPLAFYDQHLRARAAGLTVRSVPNWALEWGVRGAMIVVAAALLSPAVYLLIRARQRTWWLWAGLSGGALAFLVALAFPVWVAPLLDRFEPMGESTLRDDILAVAARAGVPSPSLFVVHKRGETRMVNAYVAGFGGTRRVVFWDTLIDALDPAELRFVAAHELAHDVLNHRWWLLAMGTALLTAALWAARRLALYLLPWARPRGTEDLADPAFLPVLVLAGTVVTMLLFPIALGANRYIEREADRFALELTHDNRAAATTWLTLQGHNLVHPDPGTLYRVFRATHPPLSDRIRFANRYRPWETGQPSVYDDYLR